MTAIYLVTFVMSAQLCCSYL